MYEFEDYSDTTNMESKKIKGKGGVFTLGKVEAQYLWHCMPLYKLETFLDGGLWMSRLDQFGDRKEGKLPDANLGLFEKLLGSEQIGLVEHEYQEAAKSSYASCWHMNNNYPDAKIWDFGHIAIRTTPAKISQCLSPFLLHGGPGYFGPIKYIKHEIDCIKDGNLLYASFTVRSKYDYEKEARILIHTRGRSVYENLWGKSGPYGKLIKRPCCAGSKQLVFVGGHNEGKAIVLPIDPCAFIDKIIIRPGADEQTVCSVLGLLHEYGLRCKLDRSFRERWK